MKRRLLVVAVAVFLTSTTLHAAFGLYSKTQDFRPATPAELAMKTVDGDAGAEAVILDWVRIDDDTSSASSEYYRIKILTDEGKKHAEIEIPYVPGYPLYTKIADISARTIRPDGSIAPFDGKIYDKVLYKGCALAMLKRLASLAGNPKFANDTSHALGAIGDNGTWFKGYRKDAMQAAGL